MRFEPILQGLKLAEFPKYADSNPRGRELAGSEGSNSRRRANIRLFSGRENSLSARAIQPSNTKSRAGRVYNPGYCFREVS
jgi:hypothetical protein